MTNRTLNFLVTNPTLQNICLLCGRGFSRFSGVTLCSADENSAIFFKYGSCSFCISCRLGRRWGAGKPQGAILGALSVNLLYNYLTSEHDYGFFSWSPDYRPVFLGIMFVLVVLFLPKGLIEIVEKFTKRNSRELSEKAEAFIVGST